MLGNRSGGILYVALASRRVAYCYPASLAAKRTTDGDAPPVGGNVDFGENEAAQGQAWPDENALGIERKCVGSSRNHIRKALPADRAR